MKTVSQSAYAWQHLRFGEWWRLDHGELKGKARDVLTWYRRYCKLSGRDMESCSSMEPHVLPSGYSATHYSSIGYLRSDYAKELFGDCLRIIARIGPDINEIYEEVAFRWFQRSDPIDSLTAVKDALVSSLNVNVSVLTSARIAPVPEGFPAGVDLAMFPPLPPWMRPELWVARDVIKLSRTDPGVASRLLVAIAHEGLGHLLQYHSCVIGAIDQCLLDSELMEGWGVAAEMIVHRLGEAEGAIADMYKVKRILPLLASTHPDLWHNRYRPVLEEQFPKFLISPEFEVYRIGIGTHGRGLLRALEIGARYSDGLPWMLPSSSPWIKPH